MATFKETYASEHSPGDLWRAINKPLLDPDLVSLVHEGVEVQYDNLSREGQIELGSSITYIPTDSLRENAPPLHRQLIPEDVEFYVHGMTDFGFGSRRDTLMSSKANGGITRTVEADGSASLLVIEAELTLNGLGSMFDRQIEKALEATLGRSSEATAALVPEILGN